jgi:hypothetical protein
MDKKNTRVASAAFLQYGEGTWELRAGNMVIGALLLSKPIAWLYSAQHEDEVTGIVTLREQYRFFERDDVPISKRSVILKKKDPRTYTDFHDEFERECEERDIQTYYFLNIGDNLADHSTNNPTPPPLPKPFESLAK